MVVEGNGGAASATKPHPHADELVRPETHAEQVERVQRAMQDYCRRGIANAANWHYVQNRPMKTLGKNPDGTIKSDCSEGATATYFWAKQVTGLPVPDPNGNGFNGLGNTTTLSSHNSVLAKSPYRVGDLALYNGHVTICMAAGTKDTARFWSNGSEGGPYSEPLGYRSDLVKVVRPVLVSQP